MAINIVIGLVVSQLMKTGSCVHNMLVLYSYIYIFMYVYVVHLDNIDSWHIGSLHGGGGIT